VGKVIAFLEYVLEWAFPYKNSPASINPIRPTDPRGESTRGAP